MFHVGDEVIKARPYHGKTYCAFGGDEDEVPIGTIGKITDVFSDRIQVIFKNGYRWDVDESELALTKIDWKKKMEE
jgi:hypothetical protein